MAAIFTVDPRSGVPLYLQLIEQVPGIGERLGGDPVPRLGQKLIPPAKPHFDLELEPRIAEAAPEPPVTSPGNPVDRLSRREREVAALITRGLTNRQIADALVIGERTVHTHVANVLVKLDLTSRTQIAAWGVEQGLR